MNRRLLPTLLLLGACAPRFTDVLPDDRLLMNLPAPTSAAKETPAEKDWSEYYLLTAEVTETINGMVGYVLGTTKLITLLQRPDTYDSAEEYAEWGPYSQALDPVETLLWVDHDPDTDIWTWGYHQWPKEDPTSVYDVVVGEVDAGATRETSTGRFTIDFTTANLLDPTVNVDGGTFSVDYQLDPEGVAGTVILTDIGGAALDGDYSYSQVTGGEGQMDLRLEDDVNPGSGAGLLEDWTMRSRWTAEGVGRGDARMTGGDLGSTEATGTECWDNAFEAAYRKQSLSGLEEGDVGACAYADASYVGD